MTTVIVTNISPEQTKEEINRFFSFCGKTKSIDIAEGDTLTATVTYETPQAYKTALLLNNSQLGATRITVTPATGASAEGALDDDDAAHAPSGQASETGEIPQEQKPRSRILAEYLAHGYIVGDAAVTRALELDEKHGVSARFLNTLQQFDQRLHATDRARAAAAAASTSQRGHSIWSGLSSYFEKASNTATGQKIVQFYTTKSRQVADVHNEARRLAELKKEEAGGSAVKAAGLERVLGKDKPAAAAESAAAVQATTTGTTSSVPLEPTSNIPATQSPAEAKK